MQKYEIDYVATYSPVVRIEAVRLVLIIGLTRGLEIRHVDFVTAFLNGELVDVDIYMAQPEGYDDKSGRVCKLKKGLYGLKQASRIWNDTLHKCLTEIGFTQCTYDLGIYWKQGRVSVVYLTVYVDDLLLAGKMEDISVVILELAKKFKLKDLGRVHNFLGMEVNYKLGSFICLSQTAYIERLAEKFGLASARPVRSPQMHNETPEPIE
ncbi:hypothetical protein PF005_g14420 [Phytophthora fragariae]|uniref:Reverse transcriptase Ty1/copia-type domain-containing protein n=1 Tax=Phytophthora fragariae TaxID=53985 RepID=A0A6A3RFW5_9STRA|nr:hypothetical protein PF009_g15534 [Phytophthora fragariae]KAE9007221.1 hypothetical protein PF011_g11228 [Phytophthora fragariae]KAE9092672.1 hypothetical protein PF007_g18393 [Phytophthora fragariae]KAE9107953.1 hypothetical protein PF010_g12087 [Phytophthora fragariae]KAE9140606.1 hypothetical protein PF006_g13494 [Phytophthora fragariae]